MGLVDQALGAAAALGVRGLSVTTGPRLSILIFHRVLAQPDPLFPTEVDALRFDRLMALVARAFHVLPLGEAVRRLDDGSLPPNALSITFDDGYADNHDTALPILQRHGLPACFFIATGFLDGGRMFNDSVIECMRHSSVSRIDLGEFGLGAFALGTPALAVQAIGQLLPVIKYMGLAERQAALQRLAHICRPKALPDDLMMTRAQVRAMHAAGMEIGAHTVQHPILSRVDDAVAEREMVCSRDELQALVHAPVSLLAYPNGRPDRDYDHRHAAMARRLGFAAAVSTAPGTATPGCDLYQLPRFTPWDIAPRSWMARLLASRRGGAYALAQPAAA